MKRRKIKHTKFETAEERLAFWREFDELFMSITEEIGALWSHSLHATDFGRIMVHSKLDAVKDICSDISVRIDYIIQIIEKEVRS